MQLSFRFAAKTDVGKVRKKNDDSAYVGRFLAALGDGMGGHAGGNVASATAILGLAPLDHNQHTDAALDLVDEIQNANLLMNEIVKTSPELAGMGTTLTALLIDGDTIQFAHIGDSRAYRLRADIFEQVSLDHTFVQRLVDEGRLLPEQAKTHPHRNVIARVLGDSDASPEVDLATLDVELGERWLLCSDGLTDVVSLEEIEHYVRSIESLEELTEVLVQRTLDGGSPDNVTVAVVDVVDADTLPAESYAPAVPTQPRREPVDPSAPSAAILRQDLNRRPHVLVGAASLATETGMLPVVTAHSAEKRAAGADAVETQPADSAAEGAEELSDDPGTAQSYPAKPRRWMMPAILGTLLLILAAIGMFGYMWTQTRYYVGENNGKVAIYNGVSQKIGPISLSHVQETTAIDIAVLPENARQGVHNTYAANDLSHAESIVESLKTMARAMNCFPAVTSPSASPGASPSGSASTSASPSPSGSSSATPSASPSAKPSGSASSSPSASSTTSPGSAPGPTVSSGPTTICGG